jgi:hypothetical protein
LRHTFSALPGFLNPGAHGAITGVVFVGEDRNGDFDPKMRTLPGVELVLDGWQTTETDAQGRYIFAHVPTGTHTIDAKFRSTQPFWFTTPSVATAAINIFANFGITFAASELIGYVKNDAGVGIPAVEIGIVGTTVNLKVHSDAGGRFEVSGLGSGYTGWRLTPPRLRPARAQPGGLPDG